MIIFACYRFAYSWGETFFHIGTEKRFDWISLNGMLDSTVSHPKTVIIGCYLISYYNHSVEFHWICSKSMFCLSSHSLPAKRHKIKYANGKYLQNMDILKECQHNNSQSVAYKLEWMKIVRNEEFP